MMTCDEAHDVLGQLQDGELSDELRRGLEQHLESCADCRELRETLQAIAEALPSLAELEPPPHLEHDLSASPCRRWLGLLHQAVDREIGERNLERLLSHLDGCATCRQAWTDLTLIHQVGSAMEPPPTLLQRCIDARRRVFRRPILSRRAATAAAYVLAVLVSLMVGNPVSIARSPVVQRVTTVVTSEVSEVAEHGRGEVRVMLWRAWKWAERQATAVRDLVNPDDSDPSPADDQGAPT
jgi:anti-sigma factor RsiW